MKFERKTTRIGNSLGIIIPPDIIKYLNIENGTDMEFEIKNGKLGEYIALWKKPMVQKNDDETEEYE